MNGDAVLNRLAAVVVIVVGLVVLRREFGPVKPIVPPPARQENWRDFFGGSRLGDSAAPVNLVVFMDYQCPFCAKLDSVIADLETQRPGRFLVHMRHWPLTSIHPQARNAALASVCADSLGVLRRVHDQLFRERRKLSDSTYGRLQTGPVAAEELVRCMRSDWAAARLRSDSVAAVSLDVAGTPVVLVDGDRYHRSLAPHELLKYID
jgi:protein-disulfide isomerase